MNGTFFFLALSMVAALALSSCGGVSGGSGRVVNEPTVDEMARIDREMGLEPKRAMPRYTADDGGTVLLQRPQAASKPQAPAADSTPAPAPQPTVPALPIIPPNSTLR